MIGRVVSGVELMTGPSPEDNGDIHSLVAQLSSKRRTLETIAKNVQRVANSPETFMGVARTLDDHRIRVMTTLGLGRTHRGVDAWIDDVCTDFPFRGKGHSKPLMSWAEDLAGQNGAHQVRLTSGNERKEARPGYERRGYELSARSIYRNDKALVRLAVPSNIEPLEIIGTPDVFAISELLTQDVTTVRENLEATRASEVGRLYVARGVGNSIEGVGTLTAYPIPVGYKSWGHIDALESTNVAGLLIAMEHDLPAEATALNTTFAPPEEAGAYEPRPSGLFTLPLEGLST
jgi:GNAT superfamily N-acetyltransferase